MPAPPTALPPPVPAPGPIIGPLTTDYVSTADGIGSQSRCLANVALDAEERASIETKQRLMAEDRAWQVSAERERVELDAQSTARGVKEAEAAAQVETEGRIIAERQTREWEAKHAAEAASRRIAEDRAWEIAADRDLERTARLRAEERVVNSEMELQRALQFETEMIAKVRQWQERGVAEAEQRTVAEGQAHASENTATQARVVAAEALARSVVATTDAARAALASTDAEALAGHWMTRGSRENLQRLSAEEAAQRNTAEVLPARQMAEEAGIAAAEADRLKSQSIQMRVASEEVARQTEAATIASQIREAEARKAAARWESTQGLDVRMALGEQPLRATGALSQALQGQRAQAQAVGPEKPLGWLTPAPPAPVPA